MADILASSGFGEPTADELVLYARDASALAGDVRASIDRYLAASPAHRDRFRALAPDDWTLIGSCLCGGVTYAVRGPLEAIGHCHCRRCRKAHGAAFGSFAVVAKSALSWRTGSELVTYSEDGRAFCRDCGTTLTGSAPVGLVAIAVATLDVDPIARPVVHASAVEHVPWLDILDDVPQIAGSAFDLDKASTDGGAE